VTNETDERLVALMAARNELALVELHRRYCPYLLAMGRRMLRDPDERQQAVQDAFVNAWNAAARFDPAKASVKTWLVTIAHRLMVNRLRGGRLETVPLENWDAPVAPPDGVTKVYVEQAVASLAQDERELIELAFYQGHSHQELAELTGRPLGTIKTKLRTALGRLREHLGEQYGGEPRGGEVAGDR
jgi:RNA polymerase sigma-70 factor (ECF subfamily)